MGRHRNQSYSSLAKPQKALWKPLHGASPPKVHKTLALGCSEDVLGHGPPRCSPSLHLTPLPIMGRSELHLGDTNTSPQHLLRAKKTLPPGWRGHPSSNPTQSSRGWPRHQPRIPVPGARSGGAERSLIKTRRHGRACFFWVIIHLKNCTVRQRQRRALSHPKGCGHYTMIRPHPAPPTTINTQPRAGSSKYCISNQETPAFSAHMKKPRRCVPTRTPLRADLRRTRQAEVVFCP